MEKAKRPQLYTITEFSEETGIPRHKVNQSVKDGDITAIRSKDTKRMIGVMLGGKSYPYPPVITQAELARRAGIVFQAVQRMIILNPDRFNLVLSKGGRVIGVEDDKKVKRFMLRGKRGRPKTIW
jgi:hypothetical protein